MNNRNHPFWTADVLERQAEVHFYSPKGGLVRTRLEAGRLDKDFHVGLAGSAELGTFIPGWGIEIPLEYPCAGRPNHGKFVHFVAPDGRRITLEAVHPPLPEDFEFGLAGQFAGQQKEHDHAEGIHRQDSAPAPRGRSDVGQLDGRPEGRPQEGEDLREQAPREGRSWRFRRPVLEG